MKNFKELKEMFEGKIINDDEYEEINENSNVRIENIGNSGLYIGKTYYTVRQYDPENDKILDGEFNIYN